MQRRKGFDFTSILHCIVVVQRWNTLVSFFLDSIRKEPEQGNMKWLGLPRAESWCWGFEDEELGVTWWLGEVDLRSSILAS